MSKLVILGRHVGEYEDWDGDLEGVVFCPFTPNELGQKVFPNFPKNGTLSLDYEKGRVAFYVEAISLDYEGPLNLQALASVEPTEE